MHTKKETINLQFVEKFCVYLQAKNQFHAFLEALQKYANLFWVLSACLLLHNKNDTINL